MARAHFLPEDFDASVDHPAYLLVPAHRYNDTKHWYYSASSRQLDVIERLPCYGNERRIPRTAGEKLKEKRLGECPKRESRSDFFIVRIP